MGHSGAVRLGLDGRTVAVGVLAVVLAVALGALAGVQAGAWAGVLAALAGLVAPPVLTVAMARRQREYCADEGATGSSPQVRAAESDTRSEGKGMRLGEHADLAVARYLRPEEAVVPSRSRPDLAESLRWCKFGDPCGGMGW